MRVLFVCTGNTCRSAMAEGLALKLASDSGLSDFSAGSCGTAASSLYRVPKQVLELMDKEGVNLRGHKSTQVSSELAHAADLILVMEGFQKDYITLCFPDVRDKVFLFKSYIGAEGGRDIPDPMGRPDEAYAEAARSIKTYVQKLIATVKEQQKTQEKARKK